MCDILLLAQLPFYQACKKTNYTNLVLYSGFIQKGTFGENAKFNCRHNKFINRKGRRRGNKPIDLENEHLNAAGKLRLRHNHGSNTVKSVERRGRSITVMQDIRNRLLKVSGVTNQDEGYLGVGGECMKWDKDLKAFLKTVEGEQLWKEKPGNCLKGFEGFVRKQTMSEPDYRNLERSFKKMSKEIEVLKRIHLRSQTPESDTESNSDA